MEILNKLSEEKPKNLWKNSDWRIYHTHVTVSSIDSASKSEEIDDKIIYIDEIEKRKEVYGICGECNEPGTGWRWCQPCNAKRFEENFINWNSGNKDIDELIQYSQLNAVYYLKCLEWIPFEKLQNVTYITRGGFGKIYSAKWPEGPIQYWDIENQKWKREINCKIALKCLDNSSEIGTNFLNEVKSYLHIYVHFILNCYGITQDPNTKDYMMVLKYCEDGNLRNFYLNNFDNIKLRRLSNIADGLLNLIIKCWDAKAENRPSAKELYQILSKWHEEYMKFNNNEIHSQMREYNREISEKSLKNRSNENKSESIKTHPQAIYTSRLLNFKNLPEPVNSSDLSSFQVNSDDAPSVPENIISECFDVQFSELDLNEINQDNLNDES
ncbi:kinase-like domain-containing protein [Rhizophagus irregularis DAOM 181602=DAOM 197198]|nr:kinase-like domain-containing protein [Rhizophagus irregularis DAOM 181602=DAOM 197198]